MGDPQDPEPLIGEFPGQKLDPAPTSRIQSGSRLIHQEHLRIGEQRPRYADPLHLSAREVIADPVEKRRDQTDPDEYRGHPDLVGVRCRNEQIVADGSREDRRLLENHAHATPQPQRVKGRNVGSGQKYLTCRRHIEPVAQPQKGGFPGPRGTRDHENVPRMHMGRYGMQQLDPVVGRHRHLLEVQQYRKVDLPIRCVHPASMTSDAVRMTPLSSPS